MNLSIGESDFLLDSTNSSQEESEGQIDSEEELNQLSAYRTWNVSSNKDPLKLTLNRKPTYAVHKTNDTRVVLKKVVTNNMPRRTLNPKEIEQEFDAAVLPAARSRARDTSRKSTNKRQSTAPDSPTKRKPAESALLEIGLRLRNTPGRASRAASHDSSSTKENESTNAASKRKSTALALVKSESHPARNTPRRSCRAVSEDSLSTTRKNECANTPTKALAKQFSKSVSIKSTPKKNAADPQPETPQSSRKSVRQSVSTYENKFVTSPSKAPKKLEDTPSRRNNRTRNGRYSPSKQMAREKQNFDFSDDSDFESPKKKQTPRRQTKQKVEESSTPSKAATPKRLNFQTPKKTPKRLLQNLTPSMKERSNRIVKPSTVLQEARNKLHVSAVPKSLPCREEEFNNIFMFLQSKLSDGTGGCIYISGVPGTGKTATVNEVIRCLHKLVERGELDKFDYIDINGMKMSEPRQAYVQILKKATGKTATWEQAQKLLEKKFMSARKTAPMTLLLIDELDLLCNKRQDVVYNLLDWPLKLSAKLVVITIANTMDLPERVLKSRVTSRLGLTRLTFQPYSFLQLQQIVTTRLKDLNAFREEAIQLVARRVAAVSGDARRALDICRRATEIAENNKESTVTIQDVNQALSEMIANPKVQAIKGCSLMERIFLRAICAEVDRTGVEEVTLFKVYSQFESLCRFEGLFVPNPSQAIMICVRLGASRLILRGDSRDDMEQKINLNVSQDDIHYALKDLVF